MFVDNIKIARNLPELISRTEDINKLLQLVIPLLTDSEHGMKLKKSREMSRERGNNYLRALLTRQSFLKNELRRSKEEKEKTNNIILELEYEEANLKYAWKLRELNRLEAEKEDYERNIELSQKKLSELEEERRGLLLYQGYQKEFQYNKERIEYLKEAEGLGNLRDEIFKCRENIVKRWPELKEKFEENSRDIAAYKNYLSSEEKRLKQEEELSARFNPLQLSTPSYLLEDIKTKLANESSKIKKLKEQLEDKNKDINTIQREIADLQIDLVRSEDKCQEIERIYQERETEEENIRLELVKLLELDKYKTVYNKDWLKKKSSFKQTPAGKDN